MSDPRARQRPSVEASAAERHARGSAEFVVNLGPPEPLVSYASSELPLPPPQSLAGPAGAPAAATASDGGAGASPKARPDLMASIDDDQQLTLRYSRISAYVSTNLQPPGVLDRIRTAAKGGEKGPEERQILFSVTGEILPGEVLALMGPSGSGKTSLLSVISGRAPRAVRTSGRVTVNGAKFSKQAKRRVGFVLQDDLLYETLTVTETLGYAAALRLPRTMTAAQRRERVDEVITALGLGKCRDTLIGGYFRRGISGGERKRVSIGHELLINPAIMMLDEPTSGLDSTTALHLLQLLQELAAGGRSIATTIHQPSSRLYQKLDKLMLLADGHVVYYGGASSVLSWFSALGFECPFGVNVADFLLDLAQGEVAGGRDGGDSDDTGADARDAKGGKGAGVGGALTGPAAVTALWASYEEFQRTHRQGFTRAEQLRDLTLVRTPALPSTKGHAAAAHTNGNGVAKPLERASIEGAAEHEAHEAVNGRPHSRLGSATGGSIKALSSLFSRRGGAASHANDAASDDEDEGPPAREITRVFSKSESLRAADVESGCGGAAARKVATLTGMRDRGGASYWMQLKVLTLRQLKVRRFESLSGQRFSQLFIIAVLTGLFWWQRGAGPKGNSLLAASDVVGLIFFELLFPAFQALFSALFLFPSEFKMLLKERSSGMYRVSAFYASTVAADLPMDTVLPVLFCLVIYFMGGLRLAAWAFFANIATMVLVTLVAQSWGLLLGAVFMNPKTAQTVASIGMLTFMLVGGFYVRDVPVWVAWFKYLSFVYWGFNILLHVEMSGRTYVDCGERAAAAAQAAGERVTLVPCEPVRDLRAALSLPQSPDASVALDVGVLLAMLFALRFFIYVALRKKTKAS